ncbi:MAG: ATP-binding cassette domain-containing protein [Bacteroidota bacterium]|nr:ATP-binding cassette domain-containing protein [Bacteroidota bacterium]MDP4233375.1 ATP-binding cassette domain-containing protein [Bacteroidota bacterium]MDP4242241.1 ATP-binding cassette domain-containing protein [Bacteroidota bacterium]MDP4286997.1 ATP-binding cassette domain-containing protein [Bacteroidota bacterium]
MSTSVLSLENVTKTYGRQVAVNNVSLAVQQGSIFGLLGPNGAGKTSTIRMITGITLPDRGAIRLFGETQHEDHQNQIGYMPEERGLYRKLPVRTQLEYLGSLKGMETRALKQAIDYWLDRFEIKSWEKKKTSDLSKGMQQKLQFILTLLHDPALLVLDEPLSGLDPVNAELINEVLLALRGRGKTIILSTHRMEQVEQLCDEIAMMNEGKIVLAGKVLELKARSGRTLISMRFSGDASFLRTYGEARVKILEHTPNEMLLELGVSEKPNELLRSIAEYLEIEKWELVKPPIKELFLEAIAKQPAATTLQA